MNVCCLVGFYFVVNTLTPQLPCADAVIAYLGVAAASILRVYKDL
jgi:hypothetical protein